VHTLLRTMLVSLVDEVVPQVLAEGG
jgi:hypothetical protein